MSHQQAASLVRRRRGLISLAIAALAVLIGVAACEWLGWPFLATPLQHLLSATLDRRVRIADATVQDAPHAHAFRVRFLGGINLYARQFEIAAPTWSSAPHLLLAGDVELEMRYIDLWRAHLGQPLKIHRLRAATLDVDLERLADGRVSWQFGPSPSPTAAAAQVMPVPLFEDMQVVAGTLHYNDALRGIDAQARVSLVEDAQPALAPSASGSGTAVTVGRPSRVLQASATGHYRKQALKIELLSSGAMPWSTDEAHTVPVPLTLTATVGRAHLDFKGSAGDALHLHGLAGRFNLSGPSLAAVGDPLGVTLPTTSAFRAAGVIGKKGNTWSVQIDAATVGASRLNGTFSYDAGRSVPLLSGRLGGTRLLLVDLGPVLGSTPAAPASAVTPLPATQVSSTRGKGKVLPARPFDLVALRAMDANVLIDIGEVDLNTALLEPLHPLRGHLQLIGGVLTLHDLDARTSQGQLSGSLALDGRGAKALWTSDLRWDGIRLERWIRQRRADGAPPFVSGRLSGRATLEGQGRSTAEILATLDGHVRTELRDGAASHLAIEIAGLDVAQGLGVLIKGDDALPVQCAVADLIAQGGVLRPSAMALVTSESVIWVDGSLSLATEAIDLRLVVSPKDFSLLALRTPLHLRGSFSHPALSLEKGPMARKLATSVLLALLNPLAALLPLIDPGDTAAATRGDLSCQALMQRRSVKLPIASPDI